MFVMGLTFLKCVSANPLSRDKELVAKELLPSATDEEWYSLKRPYSTVSFLTIFYYE